MNRDFGRRLIPITFRELRTRAGLSQREVAESCDLQQSSVSRWESGDTRPCAKLRERLCERLRCTPEELRDALEADRARRYGGEVRP